LEFFKARKGRGQLASMVEFLNTKRPKGLSKLEQSLSSYKKLLNSRSYVVIISDFLYPVDDIKKALYLFKNHRIVLIQVLDKIEKNLDLEGDFKLKDLETNEVLRTFINPFARKQYSGMLQEHIDKLQQACTEAGAQFYSSNTGQNVFDVFFDVLGRHREKG